MKTKAFSGKDTKAEERAEARAVRSGKVSPAKYKAKEMAEEKAEGEPSNPDRLMATGRRLASGALTPDRYAEGMADGGVVRMSAPNECTYNYGPGVRSNRDYKK